MAEPPAHFHVHRHEAPLMGVLRDDVPVRRRRDSRAPSDVGDAAASLAAAGASPPFSPAVYEHETELKMLADMDSTALLALTTRMLAVKSPDMSLEEVLLRGIADGSISPSATGLRVSSGPDLPTADDVLMLKTGADGVPVLVSGSVAVHDSTQISSKPSSERSTPDSIVGRMEVGTPPPVHGTRAELSPRPSSPRSSHSSHGSPTAPISVVREEGSLTAALRTAPALPGLPGFSPVHPPLSGPRRGAPKHAHRRLKEGASRDGDDTIGALPSLARRPHRKPGRSSKSSHKLRPSGGHRRPHKRKARSPAAGMQRHVGRADSVFSDDDYSDDGDDLPAFSGDESDDDDDEGPPSSLSVALLPHWEHSTPSIASPTPGMSDEKLRVRGHSVIAIPTAAAPSEDGNGDVILIARPRDISQPASPVKDASEEGETADDSADEESGHVGTEDGSAAGEAEEDGDSGDSGDGEASDVLVEMEDAHPGDASARSDYDHRVRHGVSRSSASDSAIRRPPALRVTLSDVGESSGVEEESVKRTSSPPSAAGAAGSKPAKAKSAEELALSQTAPASLASPTAASGKAAASSPATDATAVAAEEATAGASTEAAAAAVAASAAAAEAGAEGTSAATSALAGGRRSSDGAGKKRRSGSKKRSSSSLSGRRSPATRSSGRSTARSKSSALSPRKSGQKMGVEKLMWPDMKPRRSSSSSSWRTSGRRHGSRSSSRSSSRGPSRGRRRSRSRPRSAREGDESRQEGGDDADAKDADGMGEAAEDNAAEGGGKEGDVSAEAAAAAAAGEEKPGADGAAESSAGTSAEATAGEESAETAGKATEGEGGSAEGGEGTGEGKEGKPELAVDTASSEGKEGEGKDGDDGDDDDSDMTPRRRRRRRRRRRLHDRLRAREVRDRLDEVESDLHTLPSLLAAVEGVRSAAAARRASRPQRLWNVLRMETRRIISVNRRKAAEEEQARLRKELEDLAVHSESDYSDAFDSEEEAEEDSESEDEDEDEEEDNGHVSEDDGEGALTWYPAAADEPPPPVMPTAEGEAAEDGERPEEEEEEVMLGMDWEESRLTELVEPGLPRLLPPEWALEVGDAVTRDDYYVVAKRELPRGELDVDVDTGDVIIEDDGIAMMSALDVELDLEAPLTYGEYMENGSQAHAAGDLVAAVQWYCLAAAEGNYGPLVYESRASVYSSLGLWLPALWDVCQALQLECKPQLLLRRARLHLRLGSLAAALYDVSFVLDRTPRHCAALLLRAAVLEEYNQVALAVADLAVVIKLEPYNWRPYYHRACLISAYASNTDGMQWNYAISDLERVVRLFPQHREAMERLGDCLIAGRHFRGGITVFSNLLSAVELLELPARLRARVLTQRARMHYCLKAYDEAVTELKAALALCSRLASAAFYLGSVYHFGDELADDRLAVAQLSRAVELDDSLVDAYALRGSIYADKGMVVDALADLYEVVTRLPHSWQHWLRIAQLQLVQQDNHSAALEAASHVLHRQPLNKTALYIQAEAWHRSGDVLRAMRAYSRLTMLFPTEPWAWLFRARCLLDRRQPGAALYSYIGYIESCPSKLDLHLRRGRAYALLSQYSRAVAEFRAAADRTPSVEVYGLLAENLARVGDIWNALDIIKREMASEPTGQDAPFFVSLGRCLRTMGEYQLAEEYFERAIVRAPTLVQAFNERGICRMLTYLRRRDGDPRAEEAAAAALSVDSYDQAGGDGDGAVEEEKEAASEPTMEKLLQLALNDFVKAASLDSKFTEAYLHSAEVRELQQDWAGAMADYASAVACDSLSVRAFLNRGVLHSQLRHFSEAIKDYDEALRCSSRCVLAYYNRGTLYHTMGNFEQALRDYNAALELRPLNPIVLRNRGLAFMALGQHEQALRDLKDVLGSSTGQPELHSGVAFCLLQLGKLDEADKHYLTALESDTRRVEAWLGRGNVAFERAQLLLRGSGDAVVLSWQEQLSVALRMYKQAVLLDAHSLTARMNIAAILQSQKKWKLALRVYEQVLSLDSGHSEAMNGRAVVESVLGRTEHSVMHFTAAVSLESAPGAETHAGKLSSYLLNRGVLYEQQKDVEAARGDYLSALKESPDYARAHYTLANLLLRERQAERAIGHYNRLLELLPDYELGLMNRGVALCHIGRYDDALRDLNRAVELDELNGRAFFNRAVLLHRMERFEEAERDFNHALSLLPADAKTYALRGGSIAKQENRFKDAMLDFSTALELDADAAL
eukprot:PLAT3569.1.p1 GENE.PLAT3569.1~~PLAT3569.1.p1  ORF type:complete len:2222 (-),score=720.10 PLAT3569.1:56-6721(-)